PDRERGGDPRGAALLLPAPRREPAREDQREPARPRRPQARREHRVPGRGLGARRGGALARNLSRRRRGGGAPALGEDERRGARRRAAGRRAARWLREAAALDADAAGGRRLRRLLPVP